MARKIPEGYQLVPPDGGWAWVVLSGTVLIGLMISMPLPALGLMFNDIVYHMDTTASTAAWIPALTVSVSQFIAPFNTMVITRWSCRISFIFGAILCSFGLVVSYFATMVETLFITFGIFVGVGLGLSSNTTFIVLGQYFLQYYGVTTGVIMASFASGRLIFSPIIQLMLDTYGFRGVCLIIGGLMLNCLVGAAVCQPAKWHTILVPIPKKDIPNNNSSKQSSASDHEKKTIPEVTNGFATLKNDELKCNTSEPIEIQEKLLKNDDLKDSSNLDRNGSVFLASSWDIVNNTEIVASQLVIDKQSLKKSNGCQSCCVKGPFKGLQFSLLKLPIFYVCLFGGILSFISAVYISVFTPPFALQYNISPMNVATMASIRSGFEITGRLVTPLAFKTFGKKCPLIVFYCILTAAQAVAILIFAFMTTFASMTALSVAIGLLFGGSTSLSVVLLVDCVGMNRLASIMALTQCIQAFIFLGTGPFMGFLRDITQSYEACFLFMAVTQFLSAGIWALKPLLMPKPVKCAEELNDLS